MQKVDERDRTVTSYDNAHNYDLRSSRRVYISNEVIRAQGRNLLTKAAELETDANQLKALRARFMKDALDALRPFKQPAREWHATAGSKESSLYAAFLCEEGEWAYLLDNDADIVSVRKSQLSQPDQDYIRTLNGK